jgi:anti-anti-sigma factor
MGDDLVLVGVTGEVDMLSSRELWAAAEQALDAAEDRTVVVDLTRVSFLDSHGLSSLLRVADRARRQGTPLRVVIAEGQPARRSIELCGLAETLSLCVSVAEAERDARRGTG